MPAGETEKSPSAWTIDSLNEHLTSVIAAVRDWANSLFHASEQRIDAAIKTINDKLVEMDRRYEDRWKAQQTAISEKDKTTDDRLAKMNEFRSSLDDVLKNAMPRSEAENRINDLAKKVAEQDTRFNTEVRRIDNRLDLSSGGTSGADKYRATLISALAAALGVAALVINLMSR